MTDQDSILESYRDTHLQPGKGHSYHAAFSDDPYRNMVWQFERNILDRILTTFYGNTEISHLDFACGTGRILSYLGDRTYVTVGVDISPEMLGVARNNNNTAEIIEADLTRSDVLQDRKFNLITAFRFFPNAETSLRKEAMRALGRHLDDNGYLIFNNHKNTSSTRNRLARLVGRQGYEGMSIAEVEALLGESGLEIVKVYPLCVFPASEKHRLLPIFLLHAIDISLSKLRPFQDFAENLIYVCRRQVKQLEKNG